MTDQLHLFDPDIYGPATEHRSRTAPPSVIVEPLAPGYTYITTRNGVLPRAHLIASRSPNGAVATLCGRIGRALSNIGVAEMVRCGECDVAQQLLTPELPLDA